MNKNKKKNSLVIFSFILSFIFNLNTVYGQAQVFQGSSPNLPTAPAPTGALAPGAELISEIVKNKTDLFNPGKNPVFNPFTTQPAQPAQPTQIISTIVVFYDYNCNYSRELQVILKRELAKNKYKIIYRPVGMLADTSKHVAEIALAAFTQNKFQELHDQLTRLDSSLPVPIGLDNLKNAVQLAGLNYEELAKIAVSQELGNAILNNQVIYDAIRLPGVPGLIVAKLDGNNNIINDKIFYVAGADNNQIEYNLYKIRI
ncbi:MAG: DsbA family protein [Gammaproteobacteria bacterium]|nr:DsbA family protein [Gammaproteobacteria bacterium]